MNVLVIGGGGREHALAWKAAQSPLVETTYVAPGNAGTAGEPGVENVPLDAGNVDALLDFAVRQNVELTLVGPEVPLVAGVVDAFQAAGLKIFGPTQAAAQLEGSKTFSKDFLKRHRIPTAEYESFADVAPAAAYIKGRGAPIVVKADGLAAGKGVILAQTESEAIDAVESMLAGNRFGEAGRRVVIEEYLRGEEASFIVMVDGEHILPMASSQDHKARDEGDRGPNTGGMGAYSPAPVVTDTLHQRIMREIIEPTVHGMAADDIPYSGFLYAGLMIDAEGRPKVLEYNCRLGDPETQPILMRLKSDLVAHCLAAVEGDLDEEAAEWDERAALGVVMAAGGYPGSYDKGDAIRGLDAVPGGDVKIFHAGTGIDGADIVTRGGRVLCVTALGETVADAQRNAYVAVNTIHWKDCYYRRDIGYRAIARL